MKFLQKLGKALMLPVAVLPLWYPHGYRILVMSGTMQGGHSWRSQSIGLFLVKAEL